MGGGAARRRELTGGELGQMELHLRPRPRCCLRFELDRERNTATHEPDEETEQTENTLNTFKLIILLKYTGRLRLFIYAS